MNNLKKYIALSVLIGIFLILVSSEKVLATVGGPTYISQIAYSVERNSVFYIENNHGGRGCPPIVHSIDLLNDQDIEMKNCEEASKDFYATGGSSQKYQQFINDNYKNSTYLSSVDLKKNHFNIRVDFVSDHSENGEIYWANFQAVIKQDDKEVLKFDFRGCSKDQPNVFEGYMIPKSDKMAILISNKGDCFEGGYVMEKLKMIEGVKYYDTKEVRGYKTDSPTEPNTGNLIVSAFPEKTENKDKENNLTQVFLILITGGLIGFIIGRKIKK